MQSLTPSSSRYYALDIWRGVACLLIVLSHSTHYVDFSTESTGWNWSIFLRATRFMLAGVPIFFVISGYCISATIDFAGKGNRPVRSYLIRRVKRIFPPYWIALITTVLGVMLIDRYVLSGLFQVEHPISEIPLPWKLSLSQWLGNISLTESWRGVLASNMQYVLGQAWSLCYEVQFYGICGIALAFVPHHFFTISAGITIAILGITLSPLQSIFTGTFLDGFWLPFSLGILIYYVINYGTPLFKNRVELGLLFLVLFLFAYFFPFTQIFNNQTIPALAALLPAAAFALVLSVTHRWDMMFVKLPLLQPLATCGKISYSIYLIHWFLVKTLSYLVAVTLGRGELITLFVTVPLCLATSILAGFIFYHGIEKYFINPSWTSAKSQSEHGQDRVHRCGIMNALTS